MQTTSAINACNAVIKLQNVQGSMIDISGSANDASMDLTNDLGKLHTFGTRFPVRLECKSDASISLKAVYSTPDNEALGILKDWYFVTRGKKVITIDVPDSDAGSDRYTFDVFLEKLNIPLKADDANPILVSADLKPTGTFTLAAIAS